MKNVLILFGCASHRQGPRAISQAHSLGLDVILVDTHDNVENLSANAPQNIQIYTVSSKDYDICFPLIKSLCTTFPVIGIYTFEEYSVETCSRLCATLGFINNPTAAILRIRNKNSCRQILSENGLPQPELHIFNNLQQACYFLQTQPTGGGDWILKPIDASGSQGVSRITNNGIHQLHTAFSRLTSTQQEGFIIEKFIIGKEFSLEGFFHHGEPIFQGITEKTLKPGSSFVEDMHVFPAELPIETRNDVFAVAKKALHCVGLMFGHFHLEFWISDCQIIIGEIHSRPGGDYIHLLTEVVTGIPTYAAVFQQYIESASCHEPAPTITHRCAAAVKYFDAPEGELIAIYGIADLQKKDQIILTEITVKPGEILPPCTESGKRVGCVVVREESSDKAKHTAMEMAAYVHFDIL